MYINQAQVIYAAEKGCINPQTNWASETETSQCVAHAVPADETPERFPDADHGAPLEDEVYMRSNVKEQ